MKQIVIHGVKSFGEGEVYSTIVFKEKSLVICKLIEKIAYRKKRMSKNIDQAIMPLLIERGDLGICTEIPYNEISEIIRKSFEDKITLLVKLKNGKTMFFHVNLKKRELLKKGLELYRKSKTG